MCVCVCVCVCVLVRMHLWAFHTIVRTNLYVLMCASPALHRDKGWLKHKPVSMLLLEFIRN